MRNKTNPTNDSAITVGVIGLGLMGHSIIACLLASGHRVIGVTRDLKKHRRTRGHVRQLLQQMKREGLTRKDPARLAARLDLADDFAALAPCALVVESVIEDVAVKLETYRAVERAVGPKTIIATNTSSIPVTLLQRDAAHPERFIGIHWDEPAHVTRFMEIIAGKKTAPSVSRRIVALAERWGKEPSLLRRDVRGFITNRISYAMFREACHLVDSGIASFEDVDRSLRNDVGWWIPFAGPFRYMDLMGVEAYYRVMKDLLPDLSTSPEIPQAIRRVVESGGRGVSSGRGFYRYTPEEAERWQKLFLKFNYDIRRLAMRYPENAGVTGRADAGRTKSRASHAAGSRRSGSRAAD
jgi:3-hydroxybutyryl-CoA dehydrogenase